MDEPIGDGSAIPFMLLSAEAQKYVKVLLSGEGGDEAIRGMTLMPHTKSAISAEGLFPISSDSV